MRWFIVKDSPKNRQTFTNPYVRDTGTDANAITIIVDLTKCVVAIPPRHSRKTDDEECVGVFQGIHYMLHPTISINLFMTASGALSPYRVLDTSIL